MKFPKQQQIFNLTRDIETPFFILDLNALRKKIKIFNAIFTKSDINFNLLYSVKTNYNPYIIKFLHSNKIGLEIISGLEIDLLDKINLLSDKTIINGPSKSYKELKKVIKVNSIIQTDSIDEVEEINNICCELDKSIRIGLRIQPEGSNWKRFGIPSKDLSCFVSKIREKYKRIEIIGLHSHLGTQILSLEAYKLLAIQLSNLAFENNLVSKLEYVNLGGGLPSFSAPLTHHLNPPKQLSDYFEEIENGLKELIKIKKNLKIYMEPGRAIVDESMDLICSVMSSDSDRVVLNTGKNDIPSLNIRKHPIIFEKSDENLIKKEIFGCLCMRSDSFPDKEYVPNLKRGDRALIKTLGAYVNSQSMTFIKYKPPIFCFDSSEEVLKFKLIERRQTIEDIFQRYL